MDNLPECTTLTFEGRVCSIHLLLSTTFNLGRISIGWRVFASSTVHFVGMQNVVRAPSGLTKEVYSVPRVSIIKLCIEMI